MGAGTPQRWSRSAGLGAPRPRELWKGEGPGRLQTCDERPRGDSVGGMERRLPAPARWRSECREEGFWSNPCRGGTRTPESCGWRAFLRQNVDPAFRPG